MKYFIAIDGGGTQTRCALADEASVCAVFESVTAKPSVVGYEHSARLLFDMLLQSCLEADVPFSRIKGIVIGMAGLWESHEYTMLRDKLFEAANAQMYALPKLEICSDATVALQGAFDDEQGILVIGGTGSIAVAHDEHGKIHRVGGYGPVIGDEGSGHWIGVRAISHVLRCCDGRARPGYLMQAVSESLRLNLPEEARALALMVNNGSVRPADIAPLVFESASKSDRNAANIIHDAAEKLVELAEALSRNINAPHVPVCFIGGIAEQDLLQRRLKKCVQEHSLLKWRSPSGTALEGAVRRARNVSAQVVATARP